MLRKPVLPTSIKPLALAIHLSFAVALGLSITGNATAQVAGTATYNIPAGPLGEALNRFAQQSGVALIVDTAAVKGQRTQGLKGSYGVEDGFRTLLIGTGYAIGKTGAGYVLVPASDKNSSRDGTSADASTAARTQQAVSTLPAVVVTSEKIDRPFVETTSSVGYLDGQRLEEAGIRSVSDAFRLLGNVRTGSSTDNGFLIRGINSEGMGSQLSPLTTVNIDGVAQTQQGARRGATGLWDVEKVEVLRGPQSTVSGKNALAGTVNIKTYDPSFVQEGAVRVLAGDYNQRGLAAMLSGPITDQLAYRISAESNKSDGFVSYPGLSGPRLSERADNDQRTIRGKLLWQSRPVDGVRVLLSHSDSKDAPSANMVRGPNYFDRVWTDTVSPEARDTKVKQTSVEVNVPFGNGWKLTSFTSMVESDTNRSSVDEIYTVGGFNQKDKVQEFRLNYEDGPWKAVAGIYLSDFNNKASADFDLSASLGTQFRTSGGSKIDNKAAFGEVNYRMGDVTWIAGGRSEHQEQRYQSTFSAVVLGTTQSSDRTSKSSAFLPKLGAQWHLSDQQNVALVWQRGYRAGGLGSAIDGLTVFAPVPYDYNYEPEKTSNTELSYRFISADKRWTVAANVFHTDWKEQQIETMVDSPSPFSGIIENAGRSSVKGAELEVMGAVNSNWNAFASVGYVATKFKEFVTAEGNDLAGSVFPQAPKWSAAVGANWKQGPWFAGGDVKYTGSALSGSVLTGGQAETMSTYTVLNLRGGYTWGQSRLTLLVDNVGDEKYFLFRNTAQNAATIGRPRTVSLVYDYRF